jgi:hypothetical protein
MFEYGFRGLPLHFVLFWMMISICLVKDSLICSRRVHIKCSLRFAHVFHHTGNMPLSVKNGKMQTAIGVRYLHA